MVSVKEFQSIFHKTYCKDWSQLHYLADMNLFSFHSENIFWKSHVSTEPFCFLIKSVLLRREHK